MCQQSQLYVEEEVVKANVLRTVSYLFESVCIEDYETMDLELEELNVAITRLKDLQIKKEKNQKLMDLVQEIKIKGIKIDFAKRAFFLKEQNIKIDKKKQQA